MGRLSLTAAHAILWAWRTRERTSVSPARRDCRLRAERARRPPHATGSSRPRDRFVFPPPWRMRTAVRAPTGRTSRDRRSRSWARRRHRERERPAVGEPMLETKARRAQQPPHARAVVLAADFRPDRLSVIELYVAHTWNVHDLVARRDEVHLDPMSFRRVEGPMRECGDVEVGAKLAIEDAEHVAIECRRHAACVVVGSLDHLSRLP